LFFLEKLLPWNKWKRKYWINISSTENFMIKNSLILKDKQNDFLCGSWKYINIIVVIKL
jgi:hypothetical protein